MHTVLNSSTHNFLAASSQEVESGLTQFPVDEVVADGGDLGARHLS